MEGSDSVGEGVWFSAVGAAFMQWHVYLSLCVYGSHVLRFWQRRQSWPVLQRAVGPGVHVFGDNQACS
eukprot:3460681-Rhodomonas_salina.3